MGANMIKERLEETKVNPKEYAAALFYVRQDEKHYEECIKDLNNDEDRSV